MSVVRSSRDDGNCSLTSYEESDARPTHRSSAQHRRDVPLTTSISNELKLLGVDPCNAQDRVTLSSSQPERITSWCTQSTCKPKNTKILVWKVFSVVISRSEGRSSPYQVECVAAAESRAHQPVRAVSPALQSDVEPTSMGARR